MSPVDYLPSFVSLTFWGLHTQYGGVFSIGILTSVGISGKSFFELIMRGTRDGLSDWMEICMGADSFGFFRPRPKNANVNVHRQLMRKCTHTSAQRGVVPRSRTLCLSVRFHFSSRAQPSVCVPFSGKKVWPRGWAVRQGKQ